MVKARATRHGVKVNGKEYPSSFKAFEDLKLPTGRHNRFRLILKRDGKAIFEHGKKKLAFTLVEKA